MIIKQKRIRNLHIHLPGIKDGDRVVFALCDLHLHREALGRAGFPPPLVAGSAILPSKLGPVSRFNAEGKFNIHRDQPKEPYYQQREWKWVEWHGQEKVEREEVKHIQYERYPRTFVPPPAVELAAVTRTTGETIIAVDAIEFAASNHEMMLHTINFHLELFGECHVLTSELESIIRVPVQRLNWRVLPEGTRPWAELERELKEAGERFDKPRAAVYRYNLDYINTFEPSFVAVGQAGFQGYVVFGFPARGIYVCESIYNYNATYVFGDDWQKLSRLTKTEILTGKLHETRIIHEPGWAGRIQKLFKDKLKAS